MNGTSFFYAHTSQWRHEKLNVQEVLGPTADRGKYGELSMIDLNAAAPRMGWLPSAPQLRTIRWTWWPRPRPPARTRWRTPSRA